MSAPRKAARRAIRTVIGALGGTIGGLGATLVLTQSGKVDVDLVAGLSAPVIVAGAVIGFIEPPDWVLRAIGVAILVSSIGVVSAAVDAPASAQSDCSVQVTIDGRRHDLTATSSDRPLIVDVGSAPVIEFDATAPGVVAGVVEVVMASTRPSLGGLLQTGDAVVFFAELDEGRASGFVTVERAGRTGFRIVGDGYDTPIVPLGLVELSVSVADFNEGVVDAGCPDSVWVRAVARPIGNGWGQGGLAATAVGLLAIAIAGPLRRPFHLAPPAPPPGTPPPPDPPPPPVAASTPSIPARGPFVEHTTARVIDADGTPVDPLAPLVAGREYQLEVTFGAGLQQRRSDERDVSELRVAATSRTVPMRTTVEIGAPGVPVTVPLSELVQGVHHIIVHATRRGHHLQTERVSVTVVNDDNVAAVDPQTRTTLINTVTPTDAELERLPERAVLITLIADTDHTVDARITDVDGRPIVHYDSLLTAGTLDRAAGEVRSRLGEMLARGEGVQTSYSSDELAEGFEAVVRAGRHLTMALFPDMSVRDGDVATLYRTIADGSTVQVVSHRAGIGHATIPWGLIYDRPFLGLEETNPLCPSFATHSVDRCPSADDPEVWCPTGFWGYRAIIEELWATTENELLPTPVASTSSTTATTSTSSTSTTTNDASMVAYLDDTLAATPVQARVLDRGRGRRLEGFDDLRRWMSTDDADLRVLYFYTHHEPGSDGGLRIGDQVLGPGALNAFRTGSADRWPGRPLVILNACASGAYESTDPVSMIAEIRAFGASGVVTSECVLWDPVAGECGLRIIEGLAEGNPIGAVLRDLRRGLLVANNNPIGLAYRLHATAEASTGQMERRP